MKKINKETTLSEILKCEKAEEVLNKYQVPCMSCPFASVEMESLKIGDIAKMYGIDLKPLLKELNKVCDKKS